MADRRTRGPRHTYLREAGLILIAQTKDTGEHFYFGDLINGYLAQQTTTVNHSLFAILAAAAIEAGTRPDELPDVTALFRYVASTVGKPEFGILHPPKPLDPHTARSTEHVPAALRFLPQLAGRAKGAERIAKES